MSSARVFKPIYNDNMLMRPPGFMIYDRRSNVKNVDKVKRVLFGEPIDHEETRKFLQEELAKQSNIDKDKWEFDFAKGKPLSPDGRERRFEWSPVNDTRDNCFAPNKRRESEELHDEEDISDLYCNAANNAVKPTPIRPEQQSGNHNESPITEIKKQSRITAYMPARKRTSHSAFAKKSSTDPRPSKISRSNDVAS